MDVREVLSIKPSTKEKLQSEHFFDDDPKRMKLEAESNIVSEAQSQTAEDQQTFDEIDESSLKKMSNNLEKRIEVNRNHRVKFVDNPEKFLESEFLLFEEINTVKLITTSPEYYSVAISCGLIKLMIELLTHENIDICLAVIDVINDMLDTDGDSSEEEYVEMLADALFSHSVLDSLLALIKRVESSSQPTSPVVKTALLIMHNLYDVKPELFAGKSPKIILLILRFIKKRGFASNKGIASEFLSILMQDSEDCRKTFGENQGIDIVLIALSLYKKSNPVTPEETEHMENLFDCICSALLFEPNKSLFVSAEGIQLMVIFLREKLRSCGSALKVISYCLGGGGVSEEASVKFIEVLGLRSFFPIFMKSHVSKMGLEVATTVEEYCCTILSSLFRYSTGLYRKRILQKFLENDHIKVDRLMELYINYLEKVQKVEKLHKIKGKHLMNDETENAKIFSEKMEKGLFTLYLVVYIIFELLASGMPTIRKRICSIIDQRGLNDQIMIKLLQEYKNLYSESDSDNHTPECGKDNKLCSKCRFKDRFDHLLSLVS